MQRRAIMAGILCVVAITIIGICDTLNDGVRKREEAQDRRSERLERNQIRLEEQVERRQKRTDDYLKGR